MSARDGHFCAGFLEGEAAFSIVSHRGTRYSCRLSVTARDDDANLVGRLRDIAGAGSTLAAAGRGNAHPQVTWRIAAKSDCRRMVTLLEDFPLRGQKSRDAAIWMSAVKWWVGDDPMVTNTNRDWSPMRAMSTRLTEARVYDLLDVVDIIDPHPGVTNGWADFLAGYITAEGCFGLYRNGNGFAPVLQVRVRRDQTNLLTQLRTRVGAGRLYFERKTVVGRRPAVHWTVRKGIELETVIEILDSHPVRGRKWVEYEIWREACLLVASGGRRADVHRRLGVLGKQLSEAKRYRATRASVEPVTGQRRL